MHMHDDWLSSYVKSNIRSMLECEVINDEEVKRLHLYRVMQPLVS